MKKGRLKRVIFITTMVLISAAIGLSIIRARYPELRCKGVSLSEWLRQADEHNVGEGIAEIGPEAIPFLIRSLEPPNPAFGRLYTRFWKALPQTIQMRLPWPHRSERIRKNALFALKEFGEEAKAALPIVINAARNDPSLLCRAFALNAAVAIGYDESAVALLIGERLKNPASTHSAAVAPYDVAIFPSNSLSYFLPILRDRQKLPYNALLGISVAGPEAREAVPLLVEALKTPQLQANAITAIQRIGPDGAPAVPVLIPLLDRLEPMLLVNACEALMNIGPKASSALPTLRNLMTHDDVMVRIMAAAALAKISGGGDESTRVIVQGLERGQDSKASWRAPVRRFGLDHYSFNHQMTAAWLLGELAPDSKDALPILKGSLESCPEWLAPVLARSIWQLEGRPDEIIPTLRQALRSKTHAARVIACTTLAEIGPAASDALPDLRAICTTNLNTRQAARFAIRKIVAAGD